MKAFKFTLITLTCLLSSFAYSQKGNTYVTLGIENTANHTFTVRTPSPIQLYPGVNNVIGLKVGEQIMFMKMLKKHPLFVVTPEMDNTVIDVTGTAKLRNKGDAETILYIKPPLKAPKPKTRVPVSPSTKKKVPPPPLPVIQEEYAGEIFTIVQDMPRFPGCENIGGTNDDKKKCAARKMLEYIYKNMKYPTAAKADKVEGMAIISFVIEKDGNITNTEIMRSPDERLGQEALRVVRSMPRWIPGKQRNKPVRVQYNLPMKFKLQR